MIKQYVGARYVPKFYENSLNSLSNEWEANVTYEALTVVTYLNDSYTSKKPVPVTVGNPRNNPEYWSLTGAYNAQVEQYREEVVEALETFSDLSEDIGDLTDLTTEAKNNLVAAVNELQSEISGVHSDNWLSNKKVITLGDSLFAYSSVEGQIWNYMQLINPTMILYDHSLAGRTASDIYTELQTGNCDQHLSLADYAFVNFGTNEWTLSIYPSVMITAMNNIISYIRNLNANCHIIICTPPPQVRDGWTNNKNTIGLTTYDYGVIMKENAQKKGCIVFDMFKIAGFDYSNAQGYYDVSASGGVNYYLHPNDKFAEYIAYSFSEMDICDYSERSLTDSIFLSAADNVTIDRKEISIYPNGIKRITCRAITSASILASTAIVNVGLEFNSAWPRCFAGVKLVGGTYSCIPMICTDGVIKPLENVANGTTIYVDYFI